MRGSLSLAAVIAAIGALAAVSTASVRAADCKSHTHTASASGSFETLTGLKARAAWRSEVRAHDGQMWTAWRYARFKTTKCAKAGEKGSWTCIARGRPCR